MLRVAIENFVRGMGALEEKSLLTEKNVYKVFDLTSSQKLFNGVAGPHLKASFDSLHGDYKTLCADVHTATIANMENISSLANFPAFDSEKSNMASKIYIRACNNITSIFCIVFNLFFHQMHHRNRENVLNAISINLKPIILAPIAS